MEKYQANRNDNVINDEELPSQMAEQRSDENNAKAAKATLKVAKNVPIPHVKAFAEVADRLDDVTGGQLSRTAGQAMSQITRNAPGGQRLQGTINQLGDSGVSDAIGSGADLASGNVAGGTSTSSNISTDTTNVSSFKSSMMSSSNSNSGASFLTNNIMSFGGKSFKIKLIVVGVVAFFIVMIFVSMVSGKDVETLSLTSEEPSGSSGMSYLGESSSCALIFKDGVYYKTTVPQTNECQAGAYTETIGLEPNFYNNLMALIADASAIGCNAVINSGRRTLEDQARLYRQFSHQPGRAAPPGYSNHEFGIAVDLAYVPKTSKCVSYYHNTAPSYGMHFPLVNARVPEDWHIEPINIQRGVPE